MFVNIRERIFDINDAFSQNPNGGFFFLNKQIKQKQNKQFYYYE